MELSEAAAAALRVREMYRELELRRYGREWSVNDLVIGMMGDVGDLAQLVGAQQGVRPGPEDIYGALAHELSDVLWSLLVLADEFGIDLETAFRKTMAELQVRVAQKLADLP